MRKPLILLLLATTGCYSYGPAGSTPLPGGTTVRARLSSPTDVRLSNISVNDAILVNGEVVQQRPDTLLLSAFSLIGQTGFFVPAGGETVRLSMDRIGLLERRKISVLRSAALFVGAGTATTLLFAAFGVGGFGGGGSPQPQPQ